MPALQVRDFPSELYEQLREYSAANHRSIAQQTIFAVDTMINGASGADGAPRGRGARPSEGAAASGFGFQDGERIARKRAILQRAARRREERSAEVPEPTEFLAQARAERDEELDGLAGMVLGGAR